MPNIKIHYLYRDAGNFKQYGDVVFSNARSLPYGVIHERLLKKCIEGDSFVPAVWGVPVLYAYAFDPQIDHEWHTFTGVEETVEEATMGDIEELLRVG